MFRIGEFSKLTQVSVRMLRYYDEAGLLEPAHKDPYTGYRLYSIEQIPTLNKILFLRDLGFNVSEISKALVQWNGEAIGGRLQKRRNEIEREIRAAQYQLSKIDMAKKDIDRNRITMHYNVTIKSVPGYMVFSLREIVPDYYCEGQLWKEMAHYARKNNIELSDKTFTIYHDPDYREHQVDIEICAPVKQRGQDADRFQFREVAPVPDMACTMVAGPFENIAGAYISFAAWLQEHRLYRMKGPSRQIVHRGPWNEKDSSNFLTELQIPLEKI